MDFESFWSYAKDREKGCNEVMYHGCCDSWTTRFSKKARDSHVQHLGWRNLMRNLGPSEEDKKTLLRAKMAEERWRVPVEMNQACRLAIVGAQKRSPKKVECGLPFKPIHEEAECYGESFGHQAGDEDLERDVEKTFTLPVQSQMGLDR